MILQEEFDNGYTIYGNNQKVVISNQRVSKKVSFYHTDAYKNTISPTGRFEFYNLTDEDLLLLVDQVRALPPHIEE